MGVERSPSSGAAPIREADYDEDANMKRIADLSRLSLRVLLLVVACDAADAQDSHPTRVETGCFPVAPDSVQISWSSPCDSGSWLFEPGVGCRMWDWHPALTDTTVWTGSCKHGGLTGYGVVQWYEHGRPIDRFEGTFVAGRRQGPGRYRWNDTDWYVGLYEDDLPNGLGTANIAGETFSGQWQVGCYQQGTKTVAIGVPRTSCDGAGISRPPMVAKQVDAGPQSRDVILQHRDD
jgi:hypothetical protein